MGETVLASRHAATRTSNDARRVASAPQAALKTLIYRSSASEAFLPDRLPGLVASARRYNAAAAVTGAMVYDDGRFLQWLEGPDAAVGSLFSRIARDPRHGDVEILVDRSMRRRRFADWSMLLSTRDASAFGAVSADEALLRSLHAHPDDAPGELIMLGSRAAAAWTPASIDALVTTKVLPEVRRRRGLAADAEPRETLARALISDDPRAAAATLSALAPDLRARIELCEEAARTLGDWWRDDVLEETALVIASSRMTSAFRAACPEDDAPSAANARPVLVIAAPGETQIAGAALAAVAIRGAGGAVAARFPRRLDEATLDISVVAPSAVHIATSDCLSRAARTEELAACVAAVRTAAPDAFPISLGGRCAYEHPEIVRETGCDIAVETAARFLSAHA